MLETERIADEVKRVTEGHAWHGPSVHEALNGVTAVEAAAKPIDRAHSIWEIVLHLAAWVNEAERRLWESARPLSGEADWPPVTAVDDVAWEEARRRLTEGHAKLRQAIREFPPSRLDDPATGGLEVRQGDSFYVMLHGLAQHDAYHTGQIAMLKKALAGFRQHIVNCTAAKTS